MRPQLFHVDLAAAVACSICRMKAVVMPAATGRWEEFVECGLGGCPGPLGAGEEDDEGEGSEGSESIRVSTAGAGDEGS